MTYISAVLCSSGHGVNGLGIVRSLGRKGVQVFIIYDEDRNVAVMSRYCTGAFKIDSTQPGALEAALMGIDVSLTGSPVLFFDNDAMIHSVKGSARAIKSRFTLTTPLDQTEILLDKNFQMIAAQDAGIPVPQTWQPESWRDVESIRGTHVGVRLIAKPSPSCFPENRPFKVMLENNGRDLATRLRKIIDSPSGILIQEYIEGGDSNVCFALCCCGPGGAPIRPILTGRKHRQSGSGAGGIMATGCLTDNPVVRHMSEKLAERLGYSGILGIEYKYSESSGEYYFIEISARTERFHTVSMAMDVDLPWIMYCYLTQGVVPAENLHPVRRDSTYWIDAASDLKLLGPAILSGGIRVALEPYFGRRLWAILDWTDLRPWLFATWELLVSTARRLPSRIGKFALGKNRRKCRLLGYAST